MDRLTKRELDGQAWYWACANCKNAKYGDYCVECENRIEQCRRLADYEDAEEEERFIKLPLKYGDHLYEAYENMHKVLEWTVTGFSITPDSTYISIGKFGLSINAGKIGDTLFYTREEAEAKLKEMEDSDNGDS